MHIQLNWSMQINPRVAALIIVASFKMYLYVHITSTKTRDNNYVVI